MPNDERPWFLYLIECHGGSYYAGITKDIDARYRAHVEGKGARYTRSHPPLRLLGTRAYPDRSTAARAEWAIKQLPKGKKLAFLDDRALNNPALDNQTLDHRADAAGTTAAAFLPAEELQTGD